MQTNTLRTQSFLVDTAFKQRIRVIRNIQLEKRVNPTNMKQQPTLKENTNKAQKQQILVREFEEYEFMNQNQVC